MSEEAADKDGLLDVFGNGAYIGSRWVLFLAAIICPVERMARELDSIIKYTHNGNIDYMVAMARQCLPGRPCDGIPTQPFEP